jgi:CBS domain-containing protein
MPVLRDIMTPEVITVGPDTPLAEVAQLLALEGISGVPVVTATRVLGVVSATDIMDFSATDIGERGELGGAVWEDSDDARRVPDFYTDPWTGGGDEDADDFAANANPYGEFTASDVMTRALFTLPSHTPIDEAAAFMLDRGIHRVLVVDDDRLAGIATAMDFVAVVAGRKPRTS